MMIRIASIAILLVLLAPASKAAEVVCGNVDHDSRTYYFGNSTASKTVNGRDCTISIDGANSSSEVPEEFLLAGGCGSVMDRSGIDPKVFVREIVVTIAVASIRGQEVRGPRSEGWPSSDTCRNILAHSGPGSPDAFRSPLHDEMDRSGGLANLVQCYQNPSEYCGVRTANGVTTFQFRSSFGEHTVYLPAQ